MFKKIVGKHHRVGWLERSTPITEAELN